MIFLQLTHAVQYISILTNCCTTCNLLLSCMIYIIIIFLIHFFIPEYSDIGEMTGNNGEKQNKGH